jgi:hypothetical protein
MNADMDRVGSLVCSQELAAGSYPEALDSTVHPPVLFLFNIPVYTWVF